MASKAAAAKHKRNASARQCLPGRAEDKGQIARSSGLVPLPIMAVSLVVGVQICAILTGIVCDRDVRTAATTNKSRGANLLQRGKAARKSKTNEQHDYVFKFSACQKKWPCRLVYSVVAHSNSLASSTTARAKTPDDVCHTHSQPKKSGPGSEGLHQKGSKSLLLDANELNFRLRRMWAVLCSARSLSRTVPSCRRASRAKRARPDDFRHFSTSANTH